MAMTSTRPVTSTIWVGNLPFEATEADLQQLLVTVGPIKNLRLITDRESGRPKGFGFCEYYDKGTAESAHRNLNGSEFMGRTIRIDFAEEFTKPGGQRNDNRDGSSHNAPAADRRDGGDRGGGGRMIGYAAASQSAQQVSSMLGGAPSSDRRVQDQLNELLASKSRPELWEVLRLLREFLGGDRAAAKQYFAERPGLTKAVFQAQVLLGMVKPPPAAPGFGGPPPPANFQEGPIGLGGRMAGGPGGPPPPPPRSAGAGGPLGLQPPPIIQQGPGVQVVMVDPASGQPIIVPQQQLGAMGVPLQPPPQSMLQMQPPPQQQQQQPLPMQQQPPMGGMPMQPMPEQAMQPPPQQQQQQPVQQPVQMGIPMQPQPVPQQPAPPLQQPGAGGVAAAFPGQDPAQMQALLRQVVTMTDEQINILPEQFRQQVLFVKEQIRLGNVRVE